VTTAGGDLGINQIIRRLNTGRRYLRDMTNYEYGYKCEVCGNKHRALLMDKVNSEGKNICCVCWNLLKNPNYPYTSN